MLGDVNLVRLIDELPVATLVVDDEGVVRYANRAVRHHLGYEPDELIGRAIGQLVPERSRAVHEVLHRRYLDAPAARTMGGGVDVLVRHRTGELLPVEITLVPVEEHGLVVVAVRDTAPVQRLIDWLEARNEVVTVMARGADLASTMQQAARHALTLLRADECSILLAAPDGGELKVAARAENGSTDLTAPSGEEPADSERAERSLTVQIGVDHARGALEASLSPGRQRFTAADHEVARQFSDVIAVALDLDRERVESVRLAMLRDHERIARDLHDRVIQRLFAEGLRLEALATGAGPDVTQTLDSIVANLDLVVRDIRSTIFELQTSAGGSRRDDEVRRVVADVVEPGGIAVEVIVTGDLDTVPGNGWRQVITVLRECLANVVRHARASSVQVAVSVDQDRLVVSVGDDGIGPGDGAQSAGLGLANLRARALQHGGTFVLEARPPGGSLAVWAVPLSARAEPTEPAGAQ